MTRIFSCFFKRCANTSSSQKGRVWFSGSDTFIFPKTYLGSSMSLWFWI